MNGFIKAASRIHSIKCLSTPLRQNCLNAIESGKQHLTRNLWSMCSTKSTTPALTSVQKLQHVTNLCDCGCGVRKMHNKGETELAEFLSEEIGNERKIQKERTLPTQIDGFQVKLDGSEVTLTKVVGNETIEVNFNINHTVDTESEPDINPNMDKPDAGEMKSRPTFEVDIRRGSQTLGFTCSFIAAGGAGAGHESEEGYTDTFSIDEVTIYSGEWSENTYAVSGEILDGYLYDLLMTLLEEKGISNEFAEKISEFSTTYEHSAYIAFLESLQKFSSAGAVKTATEDVGFSN